ncbi:MAG: PD-(D/E)XK nuclease family protein [Eubacterium sp.]|nr:PD-(D/E)XK nuclease family protein [Candidatus Colimonas fimequi]
MDLRVFHFERLGHKAIEEVGVPVPQLIDKYGRHMLLTNIIRREEKAGNLQTYKGMSEKNTFVTMMNTLISEMKRNEVTPQLLSEATEKMDDNSYLKRKLSDIGHIFSQYEEDIADKYLDSEDYITFYGDVIAQAPLAKDAQVWIYGFDTFTEKNLLVIDRLIKTAADVNIVMNYEDEGCDAGFDAAFLAEDERRDLFSLTGYVISKLEKLGAEAGVEVKKIPVTGYDRNTIWSQPEALGDKVTMVATSNVYEEAERAAAYILSLVRDEGYRYGDIVAICNDMTGCGAILKRTLDKWGISAFVDNKRTVLHHPAVGFVLSLMDIAAEGFKADSAMSLIKSGLMEFDDSACELLENYTLTYKVRGSAWKKPFTRYQSIKSMTEEDLIKLNEIRAVIVETCERVKEAMGQRNSAAEKVKGLYSFLTEEFLITDRLEKLMERQEAAGLTEAADETGQSWNVICSIFEQIVNIIGDKKISNIELKKLLTDGLEEVQIGLVPVHSDSVIIGTLQRTRVSRNKVLMVIGAAEGVLPMIGSDDGILSENEKEILDEMSLTIGKTDSVMRGEEALAIYRNFTAPQDKLYVSYARTGSGGDDAKPSRIFENLLDFLAKEGDRAALLTGDLDEEESIIPLINTPAATVSRVASVMRKYRDNEVIDDDWLGVINWYVEHDNPAFEKMRQGMLFTNQSEKLDAQFAQDLFIGDEPRLQVSASRLEKYSDCPFAHFMHYGLRAEEQEVYEIGAGQRGTIFHECLKRLSLRLTPTDGVAINDDESPWMKIDEETCNALVREIVNDEMGENDTLVINSGKQDNYRVERIISICSRAAMSMIRQVQKGQIESMAFEKPFGRGSELKPIIVNVGDKEVVLRGIIDRLDILNVAGDEKAVRVVDYKTGSPEIKKEYYEAGYKLQLMVYLNAALSNNEDMAPAGVFHFKIDELNDDNDSGKVSGQDMDKRMATKYKLAGFVLGEEDVIKAMDKDFTDSSDIVPVKVVKKTGSLSAAGGGSVFSREEFENLCETVNGQVERICTEIMDGKIDIAPAKAETTACQYCPYKSVCLFDTSFQGCKYVKIK